MVPAYRFFFRAHRRGGGYIIRRVQSSGYDAADRRLRKSREEALAPGRDFSPTDVTLGPMLKEGR